MVLDVSVLIFVCLSLPIVSLYCLFYAIVLRQCADVGIFFSPADCRNIRKRLHVLRETRLIFITKTFA
jgi:hypothetical protein